MIKVIINGYKGKMGQAAVASIKTHSRIDCVDQADVEDNLSDKIIAATPNVVVDLTHPSSVFQNCKTILDHGCHAVVGTTGLSSDQLAVLDNLAKSKQCSIIVCPNFAKP